MLVRACADGDEGALEGLYKRYNTVILNYLYRMLRSRADAEDLTEETFFRVWRKASLFDGQKGSFKTWLFRMAGRLAFNRLRKTTRRQGIAAQVPLGDLEVEDSSSSPESMAYTSETCELVMNALGTLNDRDRSVLMLRHIKGMGEEDVSRILDIPRGTVKSRTYYAIRNLKVALERVGYCEA